MFKPKAAFSGFSVDDGAKAKDFYSNILGFDVTEEVGGFRIHLPNGAEAFAYPKPDHQPAGYTMLDFVVDDIDAAVEELTKRGVAFERYPQMSYQDENGIARGRAANMGPDIAWFKDPAGNILAVLQPA